MILKFLAKSTGAIWRTGTHKSYSQFHQIIVKRTQIDIVFIKFATIKYTKRSK